MPHPASSNLHALSCYNHPCEVNAVIIPCLHVRKQTREDMYLARGHTLAFGEAKS